MIQATQLTVSSLQHMPMDMVTPGKERAGERAVSPSICDQAGTFQESDVCSVEVLRLWAHRKVGEDLFTSQVAGAKAAHPPC